MDKSLKLISQNNKIMFMEAENIFWDMFNSLQHNIKTKVIVTGIAILFQTNFSKTEQERVLKGMPNWKDCEN